MSQSADYRDFVRSKTSDLEAIRRDLKSYSTFYNLP